ncbi:hypothetical protein [Rothia sp. ZJ1223]|uniref:hypothetical protein n=1 Tax=Rothia sp. ZJ1223 TaxID=2811098 RepID=UPI001EF45439|nr:hypothetical protein [Rothia sp. ZJ1223]
MNPDAPASAQEATKERLLARITSKLETPENQGGGTINLLRKGFSIPGARRPFKLLAYPPQDQHSARR